MHLELVGRVAPLEVVVSPTLLAPMAVFAHSSKVRWHYREYTDSTLFHGWSMLQVVGVELEFLPPVRWYSVSHPFPTLVPPSACKCRIIT